MQTLLTVTHLVQIKQTTLKGNSAPTFPSIWAAIFWKKSPAKKLSARNLPTIQTTPIKTILIGLFSPTLHPLIQE